MIGPRISLTLFALILITLTGPWAAAQEMVREEQMLVHRGKGQTANQNPIPPENPQGARKIEGLTPEQEKEIKAVRLRMKQDLQPLRNQLREKKAHLQTLSEGEDPKPAELNQTIDELSTLQGALLKRRELAKQEIRKLLSPQQRLQFDAMSDHKSRKRHKRTVRLDREVRTRCNPQD